MSLGQRQEETGEGFYGLGLGLRLPQDHKEVSFSPHSLSYGQDWGMCCGRDFHDVAGGS